MEIHRALAGRQVEYVATNGSILVIRCQDGRELQVAWVDDNGHAIKGRPVLRFCGTHVHAKLKMLEKFDEATLVLGAIQKLTAPVN